ncbi:hypothetical protein HELRODRAFT_66160 [Helobdella robusta]|uniref:Death domain-containing protein n=1 Tax=Helobdella robusta TaxID=6412 RepID=T1FYH7_HELRO|nr:hypothetical protein HELRODRAFT_66160 [Helobdella robusta]ESO02218.1 hypothetical protein HELRODRAFT_66160 [Helobdella robusta]
MEQYTPQMDRSGLHYASANGHDQIVNQLLDSGADYDANDKGNTPLYSAAENDHPKIVQFLLNNGADVNAENIRLQTPLHIGVEKASVEVVDVLLHAGADLHIQEKSGKTALGIASRGSLIGIVDMIIKAEHDQCCDKENLSNVTHSKTRMSHSATAHNEVSDYLKSVFWKLATKQLKPNDWKMLAKHWQFTDNHIKAIEHQYTGNESYKEHGYRLLLIWYHSLEKNENPIKKLFEGLVAIGQRELAG